MSNFLKELSRRNVFRVAAAYVIVGWIVLQVVGLLAPGLGLPVWTITFIFIVLVASFPIALLLAWAFELTPRGVERTHASEGPVDRSVETMDLVLAGVTIVLIILSLFRGPLMGDRQEPKANPSGDARVSIAVLPFVNMSSDAEQEYFSDGITEEILNSLAAIQDLRVTSRTSSFAFKGKELDVPTIAASLGVRNILEGSVRKQGQSVRITVQLIDVATDAHLWSQTYDRDLTEIFRIQEEISDAIAVTLELTLLGRTAEPARTVDPVAHDHFLKGRSYLEKMGFSDLENAVAEFRAASRLDPALTDAFAGEARALTFSVVTGKEPPMPSLVLAERAAYQALALDPDHAGPQAALGLIQSARGNLLATLDHYGRADRGGGLAMVDYWLYAMSLGDMGRLDEAEAMLQRSLERDPLSGAIHFGFGLTLEGQARAEEARAHYERALELEPGNPNYAIWFSMFAGSQLGDMPRAIELARKGVELDPSDPELAAYLSLYFFTIEDYASADKWLKSAQAIDASNSFVRNLTAQYLAARGDQEGAVRIAREILAPGTGFRHGALRGALTLVRNNAGTEQDMEPLYRSLSEPLSLFAETGSLFSSAITETPAAFLGVDLAGVLVRAGRREEARRLTAGPLSIWRRGNIRVSPAINWSRPRPWPSRAAMTMP